uniref:Transmembrane protein n=1 Tax=Kalanchoe fedtschenkoi TaxID=63787 RepID=A0A7N0UG01_KALFE
MINDERRSRRSVSVRLPPFIVSLLLFVAGALGAGDSKDDAAASTSNNNNNNRSSVGVRLLFVCLALLAAVAFSIFLYKVWQKKKRADQHARLLKLFEDDDELEVELGIRD